MTHSLLAEIRTRHYLSGYLYQFILFTTCMFSADLHVALLRMTQMNPVEPRKVNEEQLYEAQPMVRALIIERYEALYSLVQAHVRRAEEDERPPDPRWAEIGVRVLKEITSLYRLGVPPRTDEAEDDILHGVDPAAIVLAQLDELEAKAREA